MSINGTKEITVSASVANDGVQIASMPGDGGLGPSIFVAFANSSGFPPNDGSVSIILYPSAELDSGSDELGQVGVSKTFTNGGNDKTFAYTGGSTDFPSGLWQGSIRALLTPPDHNVTFTIQFLCSDPNDPADFPNTLNRKPINPGSMDTSFDPIADEGHTTITFTYDNSLAENPTALVVMRDNLPVGSIPWTDGVTSYSFADTVHSPGSANFTYTIRAYKYGSPNSISGNSTSTIVTFGGVLPDIAITGSGGFAMGSSAIVVILGDASGIYTLSTSATHDTLYQRSGGAATQNVAIPEPFIITAYVGD